MQSSDEWVRIPVLVLDVKRLSYRVTDTGLDTDAVWICRHDTETAFDYDDIGRYRWLLVRREVAEGLGFV